MPHRSFGGLRGSFLGPFGVEGGFLRFFGIFLNFPPPSPLERAGGVLQLFFFLFPANFCARNVAIAIASKYAAD